VIPEASFTLQAVSVGGGLFAPIVFDLATPYIFDPTAGHNLVLEIEAATSGPLLTATGSSASSTFRALSPLGTNPAIIFADSAAVSTGSLFGPAFTLNSTGLDPRGLTTTFGYEIPGVPEPASIGLALAGIVSAGALRSRRRAAASIDRPSSSS
jgi:hypothetical protein